MQDYQLLKIYSDKIVKYSPIFHRKIDETKAAKSLKNLEKEKLTGELSINTKAYIRQRLDTWLNSLIISHRLRLSDYNSNLRLPVFITLTLCSDQKHSDNDIKRNMLNVMIEKLKYHYDIRNLFWRAEAQKNGNIHFHIITDCYIDKNHLQKLWNDIQDTHGYIEDFEKKYNHRNPPSTHIMSVKDVKDFVRYCIKYATKTEEGRKINGRLWGMTDYLRNFTALTTDLDSDIWNDIQSLKDQNKIYELNADHFSVYYSNVTFTDKRNAPSIYTELERYYTKLFTDFYKYEKPLDTHKETDINELSDFNDELSQAFEIIDKSVNNNQLSLFDSFFTENSPPRNLQFFH